MGMFNLFSREGLCGSISAEMAEEQRAADAELARTLNSHPQWRGCCEHRVPSDEFCIACRENFADGKWIRDSIAPRIDLLAPHWWVTR